MIGQIFECIFAGFKVGFQAFFSALPIYNQLSGLRQDIICAALGIPTALVTVIIVAIKIYKCFAR